jgi:hypothetical protein
MLKQPTDERAAQLAVLSRKKPPTLERCVHMRLGPVEVIEKLPDRWAFRQPPSEFVEDREPTEFRPYMSRTEATALLALFANPEPIRPSDAERRAAIKKLNLGKVDRRKPRQVAKQLLYFAGLIAAGLPLGSHERMPCGFLRTELAAELAHVLGETSQSIEARLPR